MNGSISLGTHPNLMKVEMKLLTIILFSIISISCYARGQHEEINLCDGYSKYISMLENEDYECDSDFEALLSVGSKATEWYRKLWSSNPKYFASLEMSYLKTAPFATYDNPSILTEQILISDFLSWIKSLPIEIVLILFDRNAPIPRSIVVESISKRDLFFYLREITLLRQWGVYWLETRSDWKILAMENHEHYTFIINYETYRKFIQSLESKTEQEKDTWYVKNVRDTWLKLHSEFKQDWLYNNNIEEALNALSHQHEQSQETLNAELYAISEHLMTLENKKISNENGTIVVELLFERLPRKIKKQLQNAIDLYWNISDSLRVIIGKSRGYHAIKVAVDEVRATSIAWIRGSTTFWINRNTLYYSNAAKVFAHEIGHLLGFPDCYISFYDFRGAQRETIYYPTDIDNLMCDGHRGSISTKQINQLVKVYEDHFLAP